MELCSWSFGINRLLIRQAVLCRLNPVEIHVIKITLYIQGF